MSYRSYTGHRSYDLFHDILSLWSIDTSNSIYELILKQHIPRQYEYVFDSLLQHIIQLILILNEDLSNITMNKIIEIARLIFNLHLEQYESIEQVTMVELLTGLYQFTL